MVDKPIDYSALVAYGAEQPEQCYITGDSEQRGRRMDDAMVNLPVPLRADRVAQIKVPTDLTQEEGEKICRVVMALAVASPDRHDD